MSDIEIFYLIEEYIISLKKKFISYEYSNNIKPTFFKKDNIYLWKDFSSLIWLIYIYLTYKGTIVIDNKTYTYYCVYYLNYESIIYKGDVFCEFSFDTNVDLDDSKLWYLSDIIVKDIEKDYINNTTLHNKQLEAYNFVVNKSGIVFNK